MVLCTKVKMITFYQMKDLDLIIAGPQGGWETMVLVLSVYICQMALTDCAIVGQTGNPLNLLLRSSQTQINVANVCTLKAITGNVNPFFFIFICSGSSSLTPKLLGCPFCSIHSALNQLRAAKPFPAPLNQKNKKTV